MNADLSGVRVLLLQGPNGPFFRRLADELEEAGATVLKINFNGGDTFFFGDSRACAFRGRPSEWPDFLRYKLDSFRPELCFLFGDCRPIHCEVRPLLAEYDVRVFVFEDGYLRPDFVTVEEGGVNNRSEIRLDPPDLSLEEQQLPAAVPVRHAFAFCILYTVLYSLAVAIGRRRFPHYEHHRDLGPLRQGYLWARSAVKRQQLLRSQVPLLEKLMGAMSGRYFLIGLQVHNDSQIAMSRFSGVEEFIEEVLSSFASSASKDDSLVIKHHPRDRAYRNYSQLISRLTDELKLGGRVFYVHDLHLPTLFIHARGTVVINSTIGWSSLHHQTPVLALDETIYGFMGLNAELSLEDFWGAPPPVDSRKFKAAQTWLRRNNQANGSVWVKTREAGPSGLLWPEQFDLSREPASS